MMHPGTDGRTHGLDDVLDRVLELEETRAVVRLGAALYAVLGLHRPFTVYAECGHVHREDEPGVVDTGDFLACAAGRKYDICRTCCMDSHYGEQVEDCVDHHVHVFDRPICPTRRVIAENLDGTP